MIKQCILIFLLAFPLGSLADDKLVNIAIGAALDDPDSVYNLGVEFYTGARVTKDLSKSAKLWKKASDLGVISAKNNLGFLLYWGNGIKQDRPRAVALWREAAIKGHDEAQRQLGTAIFEGQGTKRDRVLGTAWTLCAYKNAVRQRNEPVVADAVKSSDEKLSKLSNEERSRAVRMAEACVKNHPYVQP
jgi:hypothetical protein